MFCSNYSLFFLNFCRLFIIHCCYSLFHWHINCVIHYSGVFRPNYSLFIFYLYSLFVIHYSASTPDPCGLFIFIHCEVYLFALVSSLFDWQNVKFAPWSAGKCISEGLILRTFRGSMPPSFTWPLAMYLHVTDEILTVTPASKQSRSQSHRPLDQRSGKRDSCRIQKKAIFDWLFKTV